MPDVLIRNIPEDTLAAVDENAHRVGLSRSEYLRRAIEREHVRRGTVTLESFERLSELCADLNDPEVMREAWS